MEINVINNKIFTKLYLKIRVKGKEIHPSLTCHLPCLDRQFDLSCNQILNGISLGNVVIL